MTWQLFDNSVARRGWARLWAGRCFTLAASMPPLSRRSFVGGTAAALAGLPLVPQTKASASPMGGARRAKNVIFVVSDGLTDGMLAMAQHYRRLFEQRDSHWMAALRTVPELRRARMETRSASSVVTDSAAGGSAWGCGSRLVNGAINVLPSGEPLRPILLHAQAVGKKTALVTTARITHATPAAFAANTFDRGTEDTIADQYLARKIDLLLGGGAKHFEAATRKDGGDLLGGFRSAGYRIARHRDELLATAATPTPLLGLFAADHIPYSVDRAASAELTAQVPTLAEMTRWTLDALADTPAGFVLQIEGARVDHAGHDNDLAAMLYDQLALDDALQVALDWARQRDDTLLIATADHGTGGCELNGAGNGYRQSTGAFARVREHRTSYAKLLPQLYALAPEERGPALVAAYGLDLSRPRAQEALQAVNQAKVQRATEGQALFALGRAVGETLAVQWTSGNHTADLVELLAWGPGSELIPGFVQNFELFGMMGEALDIATMREQAATHRERSLQLPDATLTTDDIASNRHGWEAGVPV